MCVKGELDEGWEGEGGRRGENCRSKLLGKAFFKRFLGAVETGGCEDWEKSVCM